MEVLGAVVSLVIAVIGLAFETDHHLRDPPESTQGGSSKKHLSRWGTLTLFLLILSSSTEIYLAKRKSAEADKLNSNIATLQTSNADQKKQLAELQKQLGDRSSLLSLMLLANRTEYPRAMFTLSSSLFPKCTGNSKNFTAASDGLESSGLSFLFPALESANRTVNINIDYANLADAVTSNFLQPALDNVWRVNAASTTGQPFEMKGRLGMRSVKNMDLGWQCRVADPSLYGPNQEMIGLSSSVDELTVNPAPLLRSEPPDHLVGVVVVSEPSSISAETRKKIEAAWKQDGLSADIWMLADHVSGTCIRKKLVWSLTYSDDQKKIIVSFYPAAAGTEVVPCPAGLFESQEASTQFKKIFDPISKLMLSF